MGSVAVDGVGGAVLRRAIELAFGVARDAAIADPPVDPPPPLRRFMRFKRLAGPAVDVVRACVEGDDEFRRRVRDATSEAEVGAAGWLWLDRPPGWKERLAELAAAAEHAAAAADERRQERDAERRVAAAEEARRSAEAAVVAEQRRRAESDDERDAERRRRRRAEERLAAAADERAELAERVARAEQRATRAEAGLGDERARRRALSEHVAELEERLAEAQRQPGPRSADAEGVPADPSAAAPGGGDAVDRIALARFVADAAEATDHLAAALRSAAEVVGPARPPAESGGDPGRVPPRPA